MDKVESRVTDIKFGTDGWRAIIAKEFTVDNVGRVAEGAAKWIADKYDDPKAIVGYDCRFAGPLFAETTAKVFCRYGIKVYLTKNFVSTPMVSYGICALKAQAGVVITASHNPPEYNGFKLKADYGGPALPEMIEEVETLTPQYPDVPEKSIKAFSKKGLVEYVDLEQIYCKHAEEQFDTAAIRDKIKFGYDAMYGAGQEAVKRMFDNAVLLHCEHNPTFYGQAPEPIHKNLKEFSKIIKEDPSIDCGFATDGDADRIGMYDKDGNFVDSHHIVLLLVHYLCKYKQLSGKVVAAFSVTEKLKALCEHYGLPLDITPIGFKHIAQIMTKEDVLLGGEESGGIAVKSHIPERDGIWMGLTLLEFMAKKDKSLNGLIKEVYEIVGPFAYERDDLHINNKLKQNIMQHCAEDKYRSFGDLKVQKVEQVDGYKFFFDKEEWVMIRPSGTEPVLRVYAEAETKQKVQKILEQTRATILPD